MKTPDNMWIPESHTAGQLVALQRALHRYDERLRFGRNMDNGDWCVFLMLRGEKPIPVLGFQDQIPSVEDLMSRVEAADTKRHGDKVLDEITKHNNRLAEEQRAKVHEAEWELAEVMESYLHGQGHTNYARIFNKAVESRRSGGQDAAGTA